MISSHLSFSLCLSVSVSVSVCLSVSLTVRLCPLREIRSPYLGKVQQLQEQRYPFLPVCAVFSCVQTMVWLPMFGILNVCKDVDACDCTRGLRFKLTVGEKSLTAMSSMRLHAESALEVDCRRKIPYCNVFNAKSYRPKTSHNGSLTLASNHPIACLKLG